MGCQVFTVGGAVGVIAAAATASSDSVVDSDHSSPHRQSKTLLFFFCETISRSLREKHPARVETASIVDATGQM